MGDVIIVDRAGLQSFDPDLDQAVLDLLHHIFLTGETIYSNPWDEDPDFVPSYRCVWPRGEPQSLTVQVAEPGDASGQLAFTVQCAAGKLKRFGRRFDIEESEEGTEEETLEALLAWAAGHEAAL